MTTEEIQFSSTMTMPVADGLDAAEEAVRLHRMLQGQSKKSARNILRGLRTMFSQVAPLTNCKGRWETLKRDIDRELA
jgi:hypothetical protein